MTSYSKENAPSIQAMFASIAKDYDKANAILSFNLHKLWNKKLVKTAIAQANKDPILLDLCAGTGDIAQMWLRQFSSSQKAYLLDFCPELLELAKEKMRNLPHDIAFIQADAEKIPMEDHAIDAITVAYGIRNIRNLENCFREAYRVLKPGGTLNILELTMPTSPLLKPFHLFYLKRILPMIGGFVANNAEAYKYLCQSIQDFIEPEEIKTKLMNAKFQNAISYPLNFGIATIIVAKK